MPRIRYYEVVRYYRYIEGDKSDWRAFEVRAVLAFPDDMSDVEVAKWKSQVISDLDSQLERAIEKAFPDKMGIELSQRERLTAAVMGDAGWGRLTGVIDRPAVTTGWEKSEDTDFVGERYFPSIAPIEWRGMRGQLGALIREEKRAREIARTTPSSTILNRISDLHTRIVDLRERMERTTYPSPIDEPTTTRLIETTVIDKTKRYTTQFDERVETYPARTLDYYWRIPFEEEEE